MPQLPDCEQCLVLTERLKRLQAQFDRSQASLAYEKKRADTATSKLSWMLGGPGDAPEDMVIAAEDADDDPHETLLAPRMAMIPKTPTVP